VWNLPATANNLTNARGPEALQRIIKICQKKLKQYQWELWHRGADDDFGKSWVDAFYWR